MRGPRWAQSLLRRLRPAACDTAAARRSPRRTLGHDAPRQIRGPFLRPKPLLLRRPACLHLALHRLRPFRARRRLHGRQRATRLLVPLGQRAARGHLLRVLDGGQPQHALWLDLMPERLPTAAAPALMTLDLAFLRRRLWFGDHRKLIDKRLAHAPAQQLAPKLRAWVADRRRGGFRVRPPFGAAGSGRPKCAPLRKA
jgi:hypothetical protein